LGGKINRAGERAIFIDPTKLPKEGKSIYFGGGWKPGWSTDYVSVMVAKQLGLKTVVNLSNIDYVYDKDPKKFPDVQIIKKISWQDFRKIIGDEWSPGMNLPFDPVASKEAENLGLNVVIMDGTILNIKDYIYGKEFTGTIISDNRIL